MPLLWEQQHLMNWSMTERSFCSIFKARDSTGIRHALTTAHEQGLSVIPHGAGHSYTDAALNTNGLIIDVTKMRRIFSWDAEQGIMRVEPGVTLRDVARVALPDRWWLPVTPSTADATIGGCVAMNVNGKNAWKCGSFGEHLLSLSVLLATGQELTLSPENNPDLFRAFVGSAGLLGIIISVTLQLRRIKSEKINTTIRSAASFGEIVAIFQEEQKADFLEAWVDGFARGRFLGRGLVTCATYSDQDTQVANRWSRASSIPHQLTAGLACGPGKIGWPAVKSGVHLANNLMYWWGQWRNGQVMRPGSLFHSTYYSPATFTGYRALLPWGSETFQAFVPHERAEVLFKEIMLRSQANNFTPLWCVIKQHRRDPFLLSYQVDGFSLEVNYQIIPQTVQKLHKVLRELMALVIAAGGRFYLAKDSLLTNTLYRQSIGNAAVEAFLHLKQCYDPDMLFQSNLFRRLFQPATQELFHGSAFDLFTKKRYAIP